MKITRTKKYVVLVLIITSVLLFIFGVILYRNHEVKPPKRKGAGGPAIEASDRKAQRWVEEMSTESPKETLSKLTDAMEYMIPGPMIDIDGFRSCDTEAERQETTYQYTIHYILSNRRFRKALEDLKKLSKKEATKLLTQSIQENLAALRQNYKGRLDLIAKGYHKNHTFGYDYGVIDNGYYRSRNSPKYPPGIMGRRYGMFSYFLIAAQLELRDVRPAIEDVVRFAKEEFALFNSLDEKESIDFRIVLLEESLYHPALLVTGMLCNPSWNKDLKNQLLKQEKLITKEIVDHRARTTEYDMPGREGWVPIEPFKSMLTIRYYQGVSEEQLNTAFP
jgi:hypothetical protein